MAIEQILFIVGIIWLCITGYIVSAPHPQDMLDRVLKVYLVLWFLVAWPMLLVKWVKGKYLGGGVE